MSSVAPSRIATEDFRRLHPRSIEGEGAIRSLLGRVQAERVKLWRGTNKAADPEIAWIAELKGRGFSLQTQNFRSAGEHVFLNFNLAGRPYFFTALVLSDLGERGISLELPAVVYEAERRDRLRKPRGEAGGTVELRQGAQQSVAVAVYDESPGGLSILGPDSLRLSQGDAVTLRFPGSGVRHGEVRNSVRVGSGRTRFGLALHPRTRQTLIPVEQQDVLASAGFQAAVRERAAVASAGARAAARRFVRRALRPRGASETPEIIDYFNSSGERIRAIIDGTGNARGAPVAIIPPAWGKTKETLLPLAATIVETFRRADRPVTVVRFDGVRKRGESHNDPGCERPGYENLHYTFSQGAQDILATLDFLEADRRFAHSTAVLVTFSVTSIEARHALALERRRRVGGWISVMGAVDPQSLIRTISGGVDYLGGVERGLRFGLQDVQGMLLDIDRAGRDAMENRVAFLEDARREMAEIDVPVTWIHGRHDAWMDVDRVRDALSFGDTSKRRIVEVPTGHQLKSSSQALRVFQMIATEVGRMALGEHLHGSLPDLAKLEVRREREKERIAGVFLDVKRFWRDYLVGRDGKLGMELVTHTSSYQHLMKAQIRALRLTDGERVADLGSGIGTFPLRLVQEPELPVRLSLFEIDYVPEALHRSRRQVSAHRSPCALQAHHVVAEVGRRRTSLPLRPGSVDVVLASLLINYVDEPLVLMGQIRSLLRPNGRVTLSALRRDADVSTICVGGVAELHSGRGREVFGQGEGQVGRSLSSFINDAARLLDLEERGIFRFWDADELAELVRTAGFEVVESQPAFGDPPQATILTARCRA